MPLFLSAAWAAVTRFFNAHLAVALGLGAALVLAIAAGAVVIGKIESGAVATWQAKLSASRLVATLRERRLAREAEARAAAERDLLVAQIRATAEHAVSLERKLAALAENPICYPATITKELRR